MCQLEEGTRVNLEGTHPPRDQISISPDQSIQHGGTINSPTTMSQALLNGRSHRHRAAAAAGRIGGEDGTPQDAGRYLGRRRQARSGQLGPVAHLHSNDDGFEPGVSDVSPRKGTRNLSTMSS